MNEMLKLMHDRRSTRAYRPEPLQEAVIQQILEAGRFAPSGMNKQLNHFYVITDPNYLADLTALVSRKMETYRDKDFRSGAPVLVLVTNPKESRMLAAVSLGVGSCWINQLDRTREDREVQEKLAEIGVTPEEMPVAALALGWPAVDFPGPREKTGNLVSWVR